LHISDKKFNAICEAKTFALGVSERSFSREPA
jgi:hypothetical protein